MRNAPDAVMLFAAGFGTRMGSLTASQPKPLIKVAGRPLIDHALDLVKPLNLARVVANLHYKPDLLAAHLSAQNVTPSLETPNILETGGGLRAALPLLGDGPVFTLNTDAIWHGPNPLELLNKAWHPELMDALLMCIPPDRAIGHSGKGDFLFDAKNPAKRGPGAIYCGVQIIKTDGLAAIKQNAFSLNLLWDQMLEQNRLYCVTYPGTWCDVGRPESIPLAEAILEKQDV
ncbi:MAG: nucleotidyltransferase family protein [Paracoccaceae bacterium]